MMSVSFLCFGFFLLCLGSPGFGSPPLESSWKVEDLDLHLEPSEAFISHKVPPSVVPIHYELQIQPLLDESEYGEKFTAPGKITIYTQCVEAASNITLNSITIDINTASVRVTETESGTEITITDHLFDEEFEHYTIDLENNLEVGMEYTIYIEFIAPISQVRLNGLYLSWYEEDDGTRKYLAVTKFEPPDARRAFPCFDEPNFKATWEISVVRRNEFHSLSNMPLDNTDKFEDSEEWSIDKYEKSVKMSSYLVCFIVSDFERKEADPSIHNKNSTVWGPPPLMRQGAGDYSADVASKILKNLEEYYVMDNLLVKMDKFSVPHFASGAMENWGLNTYRDTRLMWIEGISLWSDKSALTNTISHELAHQWFGNVVTMKWWDDIWLNEGFATYVAAIGVESEYPEYLAKESLVFSAVQGAMQADVLPTTHPIHLDTVESTASIRSMFNTIIYSKGCALIRMMSAFLTEETLTKALTAYLIKFSENNAHQNDLFESIQLEATNDGANLPEGHDIKAIMDTWTLQSGYPILRTFRDFTTGEIKVSQEKFLVDKSEGPSNARWTIPISYTIQNGDTLDTSTKDWMTIIDPDMMTLDGTFDNTSWIIFNPTEAGYYRVLYDPPSQKLIVDQLMEDHEQIDPMTRSALLDDKLNLAFNDYLSLDLALDFTKYLDKERHYVPFVTLLTNLAVSYRMLGRTSAHPNFRKYILGKIKPTLNEITFEYTPVDQLEFANKILLRTRLTEWACNLGDRDCINFALSKMSDWMATPNNPSLIFPDLQLHVYCTAVGNGEEEISNFLFERYKATKHEPMRVNIIRALGCAKSSIRINKYLDLILNKESGILPEHRLTALQAVSGNTAGIEITFNFLRTNFKILRTLYGSNFIMGAFSTMSNYFNEKSHYDDVAKFIEDNKEELEGEMGQLNTILSNIDKNIKWMDKFYPVFKSWLQTNVKL